MVDVKTRYAMIGCKLSVYRALAIAPGVVIEFCSEHCAKEKTNLEIKEAA